MSFSEKLIKLRKENKLSQEMLADKLDVSRQSVSKWESGQTYPEMDKLLAMCKIFNVTLEELTNDEIGVLNAENRNTQNVIESFFSFIKKTYNFLISNSFNENMKCFLIMTFVFFALLFCKIPINLIENQIRNLFTSIGNNHFIIVSSFLIFVIEVFYIALFIIVFVYIFKIAFLDKKKDIKPIVEKEIKEETKIEEIKKEKREKNSNYSFIDFLSKIVIFFIKFIIACFTFPFLITIILLCAFLFIILYLVIKGISFFGGFIMILSFIILNILLVEFLFDILFSKKVAFKRMLIILIASLAFLGIGGSIATLEVSKIKYYNKVSDKYELKNYDYDVKMNNNLVIKTNSKKDYFIDNNLNDIKIVVYTYPKFINVNTKSDENVFYINLKEFEELNLKDISDDVLENLKHNKVYNYAFYSNSYIGIYANEKNIEKLKENEDKYNNELIIKSNNENLKACYDNYDEINDAYLKLQEKYEDLKKDNAELEDKISYYENSLKDIIR